MLQKTAYETGFNGNNAFLQLLYLQSLQQQYCYPHSNLSFLTEHLFYAIFLISQIKYGSPLKAKREYFIIKPFIYQNFGIHHFISNSIVLILLTSYPCTIYMRYPWVLVEQIFNIRK